MDKVDTAIIFWVEKFQQEKIPFGILKIQKFLWYAQMLSWVRNEKFIFENLKFEAWKYGPLNVESWREWRDFLNPDCQKNNNNLQKKINQKKASNLLDNDKKILNRIFEKKKNTNSWTLAFETHSHEPYLNARRKATKNEMLAKSFEVLPIYPIDDKDIKDESRKIIEKYIW